MPINSREEYFHYQKADLAAHYPPINNWHPWMALKYPILAWQRRLRFTEYLINCKHGVLWGFFTVWTRFWMRRRAIALGFTVPPNVFGPGLSIAHWGDVVINDKARVGANCRIHPGTCLGDKNGFAPTLGNDCYIGPGAKIFGDISLGDSVRVGANAVVNRSFPSGSVIAGVPAKIVSRK
jgi:serine O-acetyltransferase